MGRDSFSFVVNSELEKYSRDATRMHEVIYNNNHEFFG